MAVTRQELGVVQEREPDLEGGSSEIHIGAERVLKMVKISPEKLEENIWLTGDFAPDTDYEFFGEIAVVEQERAEEVYEAENWGQLDRFLEETSEIANKAIERDFALDYKPANFGLYDGETLYMDNQDLGSVRKVNNPPLAMSTQLHEYALNSDSYTDRVPDREEIRSYWD